MECEVVGSTRSSNLNPNLRQNGQAPPHYHLGPADFFITSGASARVAFTVVIQGFLGVKLGVGVGVGSGSQFWIGVRAGVGT